MGSDRRIPSTLYSSTRPRQMAKWPNVLHRVRLSTWHKAKRSVHGGRGFNSGRSKIVAQIRRRTLEAWDQIRPTFQYLHHLYAEAGDHPTEDARWRHRSASASSQSSPGHPIFPLQHVLLSQLAVKSYFVVACGRGMTRCGPKQICFRFTPVRRRRRNRPRRRAQAALMTV